MDGIYSGMQGGDQRTYPRAERTDASQPFQRPSSSQPQENGHPSSTTFTPSLTARTMNGGTFKPFGGGQAQTSPARSDPTRQQLFVPPSNAHDRSPPTLPSMSTLSVQQRSHPIRRPLTNGAVYGSKGGAAFVRTGDPYADSLDWAARQSASGSTSRFAEPITTTVQPFAVSAQPYSVVAPFASRCGPDPRAFASTSSFAPFTQMASASTYTGSAPARSTISHSRANAMTASFREVKVDVSESSHDDEIILATRSKTVPTSAREVRGSGDPPIAHPSSLASPKRVTPNAAKPAVASSAASPTRTAPRSSDRTRPRSTVSSTSTSSTRSIASAALDSQSTSPRRAGESRTTVPQAALDGLMRRSPTGKVTHGLMSCNNDGDRDRAAPRRLPRQDDFELDIPDYPLAAIRNGARTVSAPLGEPSNRNASSEMIMGSGVHVSKRQKLAPPLVAREEPLSDPRLTRFSHLRQDPAATQESLIGAASRSQSKGKGKGTSLDPPVAAASTTRSGRHVVPARSKPTRTQAEDSSVSPLTSMDESSDDDNYQTKPRKPSTTRGRMLPRARSAPRTSNASVSYVEPTEDEFGEVLRGKKADLAAAAESDAFDSDADVERDSSSDDVWTPAAGSRSARPRKRPRTSKSAARTTKSTARLTIAEPVSARTVSAVATDGAASDSFRSAAAHGVAEILPTGQSQFASTSSAALSTSRPPRRSRTAPSADGTPRAWAPPAGSVTTTDKDDTVMQPMQDAVPDELPVAGPSGAANDAEMDEARAGKYGYILQPKSCVAYVPTLNNSSRPDLPAFTRCQECIKKQSGFVCCFKDVRSFPLDEQGRPLPFPVFLDSSDRDEEPLFPTAYNEPFTFVEAAILKTTCADALLPSLNRELAHSELPGSVRLRRHLGTTYTCDGCAASFLCGSWMCTRCGREYCLDCLEVIKQLPMKEIREHSENHRTFHQGLNGSIAGLNVHTVDKLTRCVFLERHGPAEHIPVIRMERPELRRIVDEMTVWRKTHSVPKPVYLPPEWLEHYRFRPHAKENSLAYLRLPGQLVPPVLDADHPLVDPSPSTSSHSSTSPTSSPPETTLPPDFDRSSRTSLPASLQSAFGSLATMPILNNDTAGASTLLAPYQQVKLPAADITQHDLFHALWSLGEPLVIDLAPEHYPSLPWTPAFFIQRFGQHACTVGSNRVKQVLRDGSLADRERTTTVAEFFETFGRARDGSDIEKIKDWPNARDFKAEYPDLWEDFMAILPAGSTTRRDGILDVASHTPVLANPPDLGPKGYFSQTSDDRAGGSGSTKLHTVNVMLWASDGPDGAPGVAAWDLYRAQDADLIRDFLYETIADTEEDIRDADEARMLHDDPIHAQRFYLDAALRRSLFEKKGVRSFRVLQRPGQAVFIPAGCAHQVCNFSDCIKVATDFVSIENVSRCWKVTDEFREQTKDKVLWRSDVLQLKTMLLWAWRSAERFDSPGGGYGGSRSAI